MVKVKVNPEGKFKYTTDAEGEYHSFNDLPAIEYFGNDNTKIWMYHGLIHRDKLPAIEIGKIKEYYNKGELILRCENNKCLYKGYIKFDDNFSVKYFYDTKNENLKVCKLIYSNDKIAIEYFNDDSIDIFNIEPEYIMLKETSICEFMGESIFKDGDNIGQYIENGFKLCNKCCVNLVYYYFTDNNDKGYENFRYYCFCEKKMKQLIKP